MDWFLSCLNLSADRKRHKLEATGNKGISLDYITYPFTTVLPLGSVWNEQEKIISTPGFSLGRESAGSCIQCSGFWGRLSEGLMSVSPVSEN